MIRFSPSLRISTQLRAAHSTHKMESCKMPTPMGTTLLLSEFFFKHSSLWGSRSDFASTELLGETVADGVLAYISKPENARFSIA